MTGVLTEREKMLAGDWYVCLDPELDALRESAREAVNQHNTMPPGDRGRMGLLLADLITDSKDAMIEAPFHCPYGIHITLAPGVYINAGCTILDTAPVRIGEHSLLGPAVQIYTAHHHTEPEKRRAGLERALPVTIGRNVWVGGAAVILPGTTIGDDAIIGAGRVVTKLSLIHL